MSAMARVKIRDILSARLDFQLSARKCVAWLGVCECAGALAHFERFLFVWRGRVSATRGKPCVARARESSGKALSVRVQGEALSVRVQVML